MKIVILDGFTENPGDLSWDGFRALGEVVVYDRTAPGEIISRIGEAEAVIVNKVPITAETLAACPKLRYVGVLATGFNIIDVEACRTRNIPVCNIPTYGTMAVAQFVFALLLEACHHVGHHSNSVHRGRWSTCDDWCYWDYPLMELDSKTMGIIGFGRIGQATARIAKSFGMKVLACDAAETEVGKTLARYVALDELLQNADIISLHCPLLPSTNELINKGTIAKMKDGVVLINTSRGGLLNEADVREALVSGKIAHAALDVVSTEPINPTNPLLDAPNCIITPHIAWAPRESRQRLMEIAVDNIKQFMAGSVINCVNL